MGFSGQTKAGADSTAIHDDTAGEINAITLKATPVSADVLIVEDSADSNEKKRITIGSLPGGGGGESNTASNVNTGGVGVFRQKTGVDLEFRGVSAASAKVAVVLDSLTNEIEIDVVDASATQAGVLELANQLEVNTGTDTVRAIVPATLAGSALATDVATNTAKVTNANHTGDVTGATVLTIAAGAVSNAELVDVATSTIKGRVTALTGAPEDLTATEARTLLNIEDGAVALPVADTTAVVKGSVDATKLVRIEADGLTTATTRVITMPDKDLTLDDDGDSRPPSGTAGGDLGGTYPNPTVDDGADGTAIHDDTAGEINAITLKATPVSADVLLIEDSAAGNAKKRITVGSLPAGSAAVDTGNTLWVDALNGNDGTGTTDRQDLPWLTIGAALTAASSGDLILVRPGSYPETGLTVGGNRTLRSTGGPTVTDIGGTGATATGVRVTVTFGTVLDGFTITLPTDATAAVHCAHGGTTSSTLSNVTFEGNGASGIGLILDTAGNMVVRNIRYEDGDCDAIIDASDGVLQIDGMHVPLSGAVAVGIRLSGGALAQINNLVIESATVTTGIQVSDASMRASALILSGLTNAIRISDNAADVLVGSGVLTASTYNILVDPALTGATGAVRLSVHMDPKFSIPNTWFDSDHAWTFFTKTDATEDASQQLWGAKQVIGHPEFGSGWSVGEGISYSVGNTVLTTDSTADAGDDGASFVDVSTAAASKASSTFTFQATGAGNSIAWCTNRTDNNADKLKHWGVELDQVAAAVLGGGSFIWEIRTAVDTWVAIDVMAVSNAAQYRYANNVFLRASSFEAIAAGIDETTTWAETTMNGTLGYWMRVRIASTVTTAPTFERLKLIPSHTRINERGRRFALGLAQWRKTLVSSGNVFGETGGVVDANFAAGSGGGSTGWTHNSPNSLLNGSGDAMYAQFALPGGICTAFPLKIEIVFSMDPGGTLTSPVIGFVSVVPIQTAFNQVADAAGGQAPVPRAIADTETTTAKAATSYTFDSSLIGTVWPADTLFKADFGPYDIAAYYAKDVILVRLELDDDGAPNQDIAIIAMIIEGVVFTDGEIL